MIEAFIEWALLQNWLIGWPLVTFVGLMSILAFRNTATSPTNREHWLKLLRDDSPAQRAWSIGLLTLTMALALFYSTLAITVQWLAGHAIDFGGQEVIAASPLQARIFFPVWLGSS